MDSEKAFPQRTILCYGDSNTFGHDPCSPIGARYPKSERWTGLLCSAGWKVVNCGLNGRQIPSVQAEVQAAAEQLASHLPVRVVSVMLGTNDLLWNTSFLAEDVERRMDQFLRSLRTMLAQTPILLIAPPPMKQGEWVKEERLLVESRLLALEYEALASRLGIGFCDAGSWEIEIGYDGVHFTAPGHYAFAQHLAGVLDRLYGT